MAVKGVQLLRERYKALLPKAGSSVLRNRWKQLAPALESTAETVAMRRTWRLQEWPLCHYRRPF